jgi:hypothetical protein
MPPRFAYWTIILEGKPTAFRAQQREELLPTFKQLQARHPDAVMLWFSKGRLWTSPQEAQAAARRRAGTERRKPDWRPGGEHRDPRARFDIPRDEKRRRFAEKLRRDARDRPHADQGGRQRGAQQPSESQPPNDRDQRSGRGSAAAARRPNKPGWNRARPGPRPGRRGGRKPGGGNRGGGGESR